MELKQITDQTDYRLRIRNFGKLSRADVRVGNFTVLAGPNNTGKSFVSKLLYSIFNALNADLEQERLFRLVSSLRFEQKRLPHELEQAGDVWTFIKDELEYRLRQNLLGNFQVPNIRDLANDPNDNLTVHVEDVLHIDGSENKLRLELHSGAFAEMSDTSNVVYLESPIYWKLFTPLREFRHFPSFRRRACGTVLTGVPDYFYDLAESFTYECTEEMAYPEIYQRLVKDVGGKVSVSKFGEMSFEEAGRCYPLSTAATGVANIGILAMLIERKVIDRGTMLFIDGPEAHLHTAWQVTMADALFRLAREGVRVIVATHSVDILKWLEVHLKKHPNDAQFVALNRFPNPRSDEEDLEVQLEEIKRDLTEPFFDLYLRGM